MPVQDVDSLAVVAADNQLVVGGGGDPGGREAGQATAPAAELFLEGVRVRRDAHGPLGQPKSYRRFVVKCPNKAHRENGRACTRSRTLSADVALDNVVLAQLGVWLSRAHDISSRRGHMDFAPPAEEVAAYAARLR